MTYDELSIDQLIINRGYRENVLGDKFSLYISNYPCNAKYLLSRIGNPNHTLAELCCSVGITLEYLAPGFKHVIGVDIDQEVLHSCHVNLTNAGYQEKFKLIEGDVFDNELLKGIEADVVIYDIPYWYSHEQENQGDLLSKNPPLKELIDKITKYITPNIIIFSPVELSYEYYYENLGTIEYEQVMIDGKHNRNQIYLGELIQTEGTTQINLNSTNL